MRKASLIGDSEARRLALRRQKLLATSLLIIAALILVGARLLSEPTYATRLMTAAAEPAHGARLDSQERYRPIARQLCQRPVSRSGTPDRAHEREEPGRAAGAMA